MTPDERPFVVDFPVVPSQLTDIANIIRAGEGPPQATVRTLLGWFKAYRRGHYVVRNIRARFRDLRIKTDPDFENAWIDSNISFVPSDPESPQDRSARNTKPSNTPEPKEEIPPTPVIVMVGGGVEDPTYRIGRLAAANNPVTWVTPNHKLDHAITLMLGNGFSQLPVMQSERELKGVISWESIGARLALGRTCSEVREYMSTPQMIGSEQSLFAAIEIIAQHQYVLVQTLDRRISGIVTAADLSRQFQQRTEPFLLLGEIEQHIRRLIGGKFTVEELRLARNPGDSNREIESVADLTLGEYMRLLEDPSNWEKLNLRISRSAFLNQLGAVRDIRNETMHFDPDPPDVNDLLTLRKFAGFMQSLRELGVA